MPASRNKPRPVQSRRTRKIWGFKLNRNNVILLGSVLSLLGVAITALVSYLNTRALVIWPFRATETAAARPTTIPIDIGSEMPAPIINPLPKDISGRITYFRTNDYYLADIDGSNEFLIAQTGFNIHCPQISPDGEKISFASAFEGPWEIYTISKDGSGLSNVSKGYYLMVSCTAWSPNTEILLYSHESSAFSDIYLMELGSQDKSNLTKVRKRKLRGYNFFTPYAWSPQGDKIAFASDRDGDFDIYVMDIAGNNLVQLTQNSDVEDYDPAWSPDGQWIAYTSSSGIEDGSDIYLIDLKNPITPEPVNITQHPANDSSAAWSPDSSMLLFVSDRDGSADIFLMDRNGKDAKKIVYSPEDEHDPYWIP